MSRLFWSLVGVLAVVLTVGLVDSARSFTTVSSLSLQQLPATTVAGLPACGAASQGVLYLVTDALTPVALATAVGSGAVKVGVFCDGAAWKVF